MKRAGNRKGQSIVEYLVVAAVLIAAFATYAGSLQQGVEKVGTSSRDAMSNAADDMVDNLTVIAR